MFACTYYTYIHIDILLFHCITRLNRSIRYFEQAYQIEIDWKKRSSWRHAN